MDTVGAQPLSWKWEAFGLQWVTDSLRAKVSPHQSTEFSSSPEIGSSSRDAWHGLVLGVLKARNSSEAKPVDTLS